MGWSGLASSINYRGVSSKQMTGRCWSYGGAIQIEHIFHGSHEIAAHFGGAAFPLLPRLEIVFLK